MTERAVDMDIKGYAELKTAILAVVEKSELSSDEKERFVSKLRSTPKAGIAPVVFCKDCVFGGSAYCKAGRVDYMLGDYDFCSRGPFLNRGDSTERGAHL